MFGGRAEERNHQRNTREEQPEREEENEERVVLRSHVSERHSLILQKQSRKE